MATGIDAQRYHPFQLGAVEISHPFVQAALSGYSDWPMRTMAKRFGASYAVAEVMIDRFVNEATSAKTKHHFYVADEDHPVGAQLMGTHPDDFPNAAIRLVDCGFDVIDINFGCPVKSAIGGCRGGYHLSQPEFAQEIIQRVINAVGDRVPVTVKMRRGIDDSTESTDRFFTILDAAFAMGVSAVTVHGRTVEQKYNGPSSWDFLKSVKQHAGERVILGSGDLFEAPDCIRMIEETGVDGVTIARGAIGNPWIFRQCQQLATGESETQAPTLQEQREVMEEHLRLNIEHYPPGKGFGSFKKLAFRYADLHPQAVDVQTAFGRMKSLDDWNAIMDRFYPRCPNT